MAPAYQRPEQTKDGRSPDWPELRHLPGNVRNTVWRASWGKLDSNPWQRGRGETPGPPCRQCPLAARPEGTPSGNNRLHPLIAPGDYVIRRRYSNHVLSGCLGPTGTTETAYARVTPHMVRWTGRDVSATERETLAPDKEFTRKDDRPARSFLLGALAHSVWALCVWEYENPRDPEAPAEDQETTNRKRATRMDRSFLRLCYSRARLATTWKYHKRKLWALNGHWITGRSLQTISLPIPML